MKSIKILAMLLCLALLTTGLAFAEEAVSEQLEAPVALEDEIALGGEGNVEADEADVPGLDIEFIPKAKYVDDDDIGADLEVEGRSASAKLREGDSIYITMLNHDAKGWKSSNKKIATVEKLSSNEALVTAKKEGSVTISAKTPKNKAITIKIKVLDAYAPSSVEITHDALEDGVLTIWTGCKLDLGTELEPEDARTTFTWKSSKMSVLSISKRGHIRGVKAGTAKVTVTTKNNKKDTITVEVVDNKLKDLNDKPTKDDVLDLEDELDFWLKSVSISGDGKLTCKVYLLNGTNKAIKELKNFKFYVELNMDGDDYAIAQNTFSKIAVKCAKRSTAEFKITFPASKVLQTEYGPVPLIAYEPEDFSLRVVKGKVK